LKVLVMVARDPMNPYLGGGELTFAEWSRELVRSGHEVDYVCSTFPGAPRESEFDGVRVHRLAGEGMLGAAAYLEYFRRYRGRVDVVVEDMLGGSKLPFSAPLYVREPVITVWHQDHIPLFRAPFPRATLPVLEGLERFLLRIHRDCYTLVPSTASAHSFEAKGGDPQRVRVYQPGISESMLNQGDPLPYAARKPQLLSLGKIRRYKSAHIAIRVLDRLRTDFPQLQLTIAGRMGGVDYYRELVALVRDLDLGARVHFEIDVSEARKIELLRESLVLLATAPIEGYGVALIEAGACGVPVVGTTGIPEDALMEGVNGFRVAYGDIPAMAERVKRIVGDPTTFETISRAARSRALGATWSRSARPLLELLSELPRSAG
jgi:glycosyltransferase involved in cell wall biosynthesis